MRRKVCIKDVGPKGIGLVAKVSCLFVAFSPLPSSVSLGSGSGLSFLPFYHTVYMHACMHELLWWEA